MTTAPAFTFTGFDYAGPLYVNGEKKKTEKKVWICLYTCCVTRVVHLDIVPDLTPEAFLEVSADSPQDEGYLPRLSQTMERLLSLFPNRSKN